MKKHSAAKKRGAAKKGQSATKGQSAKATTAPAVIAGSVVRDLVDSNERRIAELQHELEAALVAADQAERRVAGLTGQGASNGSAVRPGTGTTGSDAGVRPAAPRTTVVTRPRPQAG